jgi:hypothetical protein
MGEAVAYCVEGKVGRRGQSSAVQQLSMVKLGGFNSDYIDVGECLLEGGGTADL